MKNHLLTIAIVSVLTATPAAFAGNGNGRDAPPLKNNITAPTVVAALTPTESASLLFMREEERVARDVYLVLAATWDIAPFAKIAQSEQQHMDAIAQVMARYGLTDPSNPVVSGVFANTDLQALYNDLTAQGEVSQLEALRIGALIEEVDIDDLNNALAATENPDLIRVYNNLLRGSYNHLRAFITALKWQSDESYIAQYLTQEAVDAIVTASDRDAGGGHGAGAGGHGAGGARR